MYNFENAILHANGDYIFLCDQDDIWLPDKIESMIPFFNEFDLVVSDCVVVDENLNVLNHSFFDKMHSRSGFCKNFIKNTYLGCCMAFKNEILSYVLPFPDGIAMHDIWIGLSVELNGNSFFLHKPLMLYRRHGNNASFGGGKSKYSLRHKIEYRLNFLINLLKRKIKYKLAGSIH